MKGKKPLLTLGDVKYVSIADGYFFGGSVSPQHGGPSAKFLYLTVGKKFYKEVAAALQAKVPHFTSKITVNVAGDATPGDVNMSGWMHQRAVYSSLVYDVDRGFARLFWRVGLGAFAIEGSNNWLETAEVSSERVAEDVLRAMEHLVGEDAFARG